MKRTLFRGWEIDTADILVRPSPAIVHAVDGKGSGDAFELRVAHVAQSYRLLDSRIIELALEILYLVVVGQGKHFCHRLHGLPANRYSLVEENPLAVDPHQSVAGISTSWLGRELVHRFLLRLDFFSLGSRGQPPPPADGPP